jgi:hypothetical protein
MRCLVQAAESGATLAGPAPGRGANAYGLLVDNSPLPFQSFHGSPDLSSCLEADVEEAREFRAGHPAQITHVLIPGTKKGSQNYGPEPEAMCCHGRLIVEPDVHPRGPISTSRPGACAKAYFLSHQKANLVRLMSHCEKRLLERPSRRENLLTF